MLRWRIAKRVLLARAVHTTADITADLVDPGMEARRRAQAVQMAPGFEQRLLDHVVDNLRLHAARLRDTRQPSSCGRQDAILISQQRRSQPLALARQSA